MDVLLDTNVVLNFITGREDPFRVSSEKIMDHAVEGHFHGFVAIHSLSTMWYILRKQKGEDETRLLLGEICDILTVAVISHENVKRALQNKSFHDFEDCLQDECACSVNADYLVTCNVKDFVSAKTRIVSPTEFLSILKSSD